MMMMMMMTLSMAWNDIYSATWHLMGGCLLLQADPEGFIRSLDADTGPDADNPRACGVALLLCMLRKGASHVAEAMLAYVAHLQVCPGLLPLPSTVTGSTDQALVVVYRRCR